ncbi:MAG: sugar phosphate isomerase/epimerase [Rhizobiales bacterium]|nr:sugar phosphate isomerase/epimerase [Hyphomicrobiales bacterium]
MKVGCFSLIDPFTPLEHQLAQIQDMGFKYADVTDNHTGASLLGTIDMTASVSLDSNPADIKAAYSKYGLEITSVCCHANLLDPPAPFRYGTTEIMKGIYMANALGVRDVITTEGHMQTDWSKNLSEKERIFAFAEKLYEPARLAEALGVRILIEPHGIISDDIAALGGVLDKLGNVSSVGVNLDTGNCWLGGTDPVEMAKAFKDQIGHIHWKDMPADMESERGKSYGCGMGSIAIGDGVVDIEGVIAVLGDSVEYTTLEVAGTGALLASYEYLKHHGAE